MSQNNNSQDLGASSRQDAILEVQDLSKNFGGIEAVADLSFDITEGSTTALIGPNGAGKTTVFNLISGLIKPTKGHIYFKGDEVTSDPSRRRSRAGLGRTFQDSELFPELTVLENLIVASSEDDSYKRALELLDLINMVDKKRTLAENLSYGQSKLVGIARAFMLNPAVILLDEPLAGINPSLQNEILDTANLLQEEYKTTYFLIEHDMNIVMDWCERVLVMDAGKLLADGTPAEIQENDAVLEAYFGEVRT